MLYYTITHKGEIMFSWETCDTNESIPNVYSLRGARPVYLLQPNGKQPIEELEYEGSGVFGNKDAFIWLAETNLPEELNYLSDNEKRTIGILMDNKDSGIYKDVEDGTYHSYHYGNEIHKILPDDCPIVLQEVWNFAASYKNGMTYNEAINAGILVRGVKDIFDALGIEIKPLKFSFNKSAIYEECSASKIDPTQGYFYAE